MKQATVQNNRRLRRRQRVRRRIRGSAERPRLTVFRSANHIYAQIVDDDSGRTLAQTSTRDKSVGEGLKYGGNAAAAKSVGQALAERAKAAGVEAVCFDRGDYAFHGRVKALAEAAREGGLKF